jgi:hypothetical protein
MMEKDNFKSCIPKDAKGYIDGSCFISPKLIVGNKLIEFNTEEEYVNYIKEHNLKENEYQDCSSGMYFHVKYKSSFKPNRCL